MVIIIDSGLCYGFGHHLNYDKLVKEEYERRGVTCIVYGYEGATDPGVKSIARTELPSYLYRKPVFKELHSTVEKYRTSLQRILNTQSEHASHIFFPNTGIIDLIALGTIEEKYLYGKKVSLILRFSQIGSLFEESIDSKAIFIFYASLLAQRANFKIFADTLSLTNLWNSEGVPCRLAPIPIDPSLSYSSLPSNPKYDICFLGQQAIGKGLEFLIDGFRTVRKQGYVPTAFVQSLFLNSEYFNTQSCPNAFFYPAQVPSTIFYSLVQNSSITSNFYDPSGYKYQSSNVLLELLICGRIPLISDYAFAREILPASLVQLLQPYSLTGFCNSIAVSLNLAKMRPSVFCDELATLSKRLRVVHNPRSLIDELEFQS